VNHTYEGMGVAGETATVSVEAVWGMRERIVAGRVGRWLILGSKDELGWGQAASAEGDSHI